MRIDLSNLDSIQDPEALRATLRSALEQTRSDASRLRAWEEKAGELESSRQGFLSLMSQLSESRRLAAKTQEALLRVQQEKDSLLAQIPGGTDSQEALLSMLEAKKTAENKAHRSELEKEAFASRLREWETRAAEFEDLLKHLEERETRVRSAERALKERENALAALEEEYTRKRKELDGFKERMRAEVNGLKSQGGRTHKEEPLP